MHEIGRLVLNRNPENYHRDVEQSASSPGSLVPGIVPSPDMLLNWRIWFYRDAQYHRLGVNLHQVPVNCPFMTKYYSPLSRDGPLRTDANGGRDVHYTPHSFASSPATKPDADWQPSRFRGKSPVMARQSPFKHEGTPSEYDQVRELYTRVMTADARARLHANIAGVLKDVDPIVQRRFITQCHTISPEYSRGVYALLVKPAFSLDESMEAAEGAHLVKLRGTEHGSARAK
ncbi:catalase [Geranomyces variabilis]|nr:catalase [Geranomyces variabilis]KAJ3135813.1 hypothetical protein HDU90_003552 [Geranomyces variabilis]